MAKKRAKGNGEGTIYKDGKNYRGQFAIGRKSDGSILRKSFSGKTKIEVIKKRDDYVASNLNGTYIDPSKITFGEWLLYWLKTYKQNSRPKNYDTMEYHITKHLIPSLGHVRLQDLTTDLIQEMYNEKYQTGKLDGSGGLSPKTVKHFHETVRMALNKAVSNKLIITNPSLECEFKYLERKTKKKYFTTEENDSIIHAINPSIRSELLILTTIMTGLRKGEVIALTWEDVDFNNLVIKVNRSITVYKDRNNQSSKNYVVEVKDPKTHHSRRNVPITNKLLNLLKKHKQDMMEENLAAGRSNKDYNIVFQTKNGTHHNQSNISRTWDRILIKANVDHVPFHSTRHSYATRLAEKNLHPKVTQALMGHSRISTTMDIYSHVSNGMLESSRASISEIFNIDNNLLNEQIIKESSPSYIAV